MPAVVQYMRCSHSDWNVSTQQKLVFFTDETDPAYLEALTSGLAALPRWGGGVIHGDPEVVKHLEEEDKTDNYLVYAASPHVPTPSPWQACRRVRGPTPAAAIHPDTHRTAPQCLKGGAEWGLTRVSCLIWHLWHTGGQPPHERCRGALLHGAVPQPRAVRPDGRGAGAALLPPKTTKN